MGEGEEDYSVGMHGLIVSVLEVKMFSSEDDVHQHRRADRCFSKLISHLLT